MIFIETKLKGAYIIEPEKLEDERGFFARTWDKKIFEKKHLDSNLVECSISYNKKKGTLRGMHYQITPNEEIKVVRCTKGKIYDVIIDIRQNSSTFKQWISIELDDKNHRLLYIPKGFAHGFQTLEDHSEIFYQISEEYHSESARGIRWNDSTFRIKWPLEVTTMSERDQQFMDYKAS